MSLGSKLFFSFKTIANCWILKAHNLILSLAFKVKTLSCLIQNFAFLLLWNTKQLLFFRNFQLPVEVQTSETKKKKNRKQKKQKKWNDLSHKGQTAQTIHSLLNEKICGKCVKKNFSKKKTNERQSCHTKCKAKTWHQFRIFCSLNLFFLSRTQHKKGKWEKQKKQKLRVTQKYERKAQNERRHKVQTSPYKQSARTICKRKRKKQSVRQRESSKSNRSKEKKRTNAKRR
jgi:hypothetical protein